MKKNKSKVPAVPVPPASPVPNKVGKPDNKMIADGIMNNMFKEFDKMSSEEKEKFKQQTLESLRKAIHNITDGNGQRRIAPKSNTNNHYVLNPQGRAVVPENDVSDLIKQKPLNEQETELLRCKVSEYLKSFSIFGYDLNGNRVLITSCKTMQDRDAIFQMAQHIPPVLFQVFNGRPPEMDDIF